MLKIGLAPTKDIFMLCSKKIVVSIYDENESVRVHTNRVLLPEDDLFVHQLEQIISETMQVSLTTLFIVIRNTCP